MLKNGSKLHLSKIMGSVELLKSYISLRKFEKLIKFFSKISKKSIFRAVFESVTNTTVLITSYYSDNINSYWAISHRDQVRVITHREAIIRLYLIYNDLSIICSRI